MPGYDGCKRKKGSKVHLAVDTPGLLPDLLVTPANEQERGQVQKLAETVQEAADNSVTTAFADQGYTSETGRGGRQAGGHGVGGGETLRSQEWLRPPAQTLGGGVQLCLDRPLSQAGPGTASPSS